MDTQKSEIQNAAGIIKNHLDPSREGTVTETVTGAVTGTVTGP